MLLTICYCGIGCKILKHYTKKLRQTKITKSNVKWFYGVLTYPFLHMCATNVCAEVIEMANRIKNFPKGHFPKLLQRH